MKADKAVNRSGGQGVFRISRSLAAARLPMSFWHTIENVVLVLVIESRQP